MKSLINNYFTYPLQVISLNDKFNYWVGFGLMNLLFNLIFYAFKIWLPNSLAPYMNKNLHIQVFSVLKLYFIRNLQLHS